MPKPYQSDAYTASIRARLRGFCQRGPDAVHRVPEGEPGVGIGEPERPADAEVPEAARVRPQRALRLGELEPEPEPRGPPEDEVGAGRVLGGGLRERLRSPATRCPAPL